MARFQSRWFGRSTSARRSARMTPRALLMVRGLEERCVPAALVVMDNGDNGGSTQLRQILATADTNNQDDTITFGNGITSISLLLGQLSLTTNNNLLTIDGGSSVTINASASDRIFNFNVAGGNPTITLKNMTLANGNVTGNGGAILLNNDALVCTSVTFSNNKASGSGGAVATLTGVSETLSFTNCTFTGNSAVTAGGAIAGIGSVTMSVTGSTFTSNSGSSTSSGAGGAINVAGGTSSFTVNSSTFTLNTAFGSTGGAINAPASTSSTTTITSSFFSQNSSASNGGAFAGAGTSSTFNFSACTITNNQASGASGGGGLRFQGTAASVTIDGTAITNNTAINSGSGGGISNTATSTPTFNITNSLIANNTASTGGGGIDVTSPNTTITNSTLSGNVLTSGSSTVGGGAINISTGTLTINNSTIYANSANNGTMIGGGIRKTQTTTLTLNSTIVAKNVATGGGQDIGSTVAIGVVGTRNLVSVIGDGNFTLDPNNLTGMDPLLNPLGNNGGPTQTHSIQSGSPVFNAGSNALGLTYDQRGGDGTGPLTDYPRVNGSAADIGAFEGVSPDPGANATLPGVPPANVTYTASVVYTDETGINTAKIDVNDVLLSGPGYPVAVSPSTFSFSGSGKSVTATYTFIPPGASWDYTDDGQYTLTMQKNEVYDTDGVPNAVPAGVLGTFDVTISLPNPLVVDNQGDGDDSNYGAGQLTLREAIRLSNATFGQVDSITFDPSLSGKTITITSEISITDGVTITGLGAGNLKLSGGNTNRIFYVNLSTGTDTVVLNQMKLADGNATAGQGGAISVFNGNLTTNSVTLDLNQSSLATGAGGGAIAFAPAAKLTLNNSTFTNNSANGTFVSSTGGGGAIITTGLATVTLNNTLMNGNVSTQDSGGAIRGQSTINLAINDSTISNNMSGGSGGAAFLNIGNSVVALTRSTISGNIASGTAGGGFYFGSITIASTFTAVDSTLSGNSAASGGALAFRVGTATFTQSTLSGNQATGFADGGGAIAMLAGNATLTLNNSTVTGNNANAGGGIRKATTSSTVAVTLNSTIVAGNSAFTGPDIDCNGTPAVVIGGGNNLVGVADAGNFSLTGSNKTGTTAAPLDPLLDVLANNGGTTQTHALKAGSPAFNSGSNPLSLTFDQRGAGFPRLVQTGVDIGAYEGFNPIPEYSATLPNVPPINATYKATVVYSDETGINTGSIDINDVRLSGPGYGSPETPISATVKSGNNGDKSVTVEYVFTPPGGSWDYPDNGTYQLDVQANQVFDTDGSPHAAVAGKVGSFLVNLPQPTYVVDNIDDIDDADYSAGNFTLREAINRANAATGSAQTITFSPSLNGQTIKVGTALNISDPVSIIGPGAGNLTISGESASTIFVTSIATAGSAVSFSGLKIANGSAASGSALTIANESVTLTDCVIDNNVNSGAGGAISVNNAAATLTITNCTLNGNTSTSGGAITVKTNAALFVNNSLFTNNVTTSGNTGGAIRFVGSTSIGVNVAIRNSTFTGNKTPFHGGAIGFQNVFVGTALVQNCTVTGNYSDTDNNGTGNGGGVAIGTAGVNGKVLLESCIIYGNFRGTTAPVANDVGNLSNATLEAKFCLIGDASTALNFVPDAKTTSLLGQNPLLNSLANNGGPTQTMSFQSGSPALNNGSNPASLTNDQRGAPYQRTSGVGTDIGAWEFQYAPTVASVTFGDGTNQRSMVKQIVVTFSEAVNFAPNVVSAFTLTRTGSGLPTGNVSLVANPTNGPASSVTITFSGSLTENGSLVDGFYDLTISAGVVSGVGGALDGNNDGIAGGAYSVTGTTTNKFFRLFGDSDGSGVTDLTDFAAFRGVFNLGANNTFDFDNDGNVTLSDFAQFRARFNLSP